MPRNLPGDNPTQSDSYRGHGEWPHCLPGKWETTLLDPVYPAPGAGQRCGRTPPGGKQCTHILDPFGRHAACCAKGLYTRKHDRIRDLITKLARQAGFAAATEQAMLIPDQIMSDGQLARAVSDPSTGRMYTSLNPRGQNYGSTSKSTLSAPS